MHFVTLVNVHEDERVEDLGRIERLAWVADGRRGVGGLLGVEFGAHVHADVDVVVEVHEAFRHLAQQLAV